MQLTFSFIDKVGNELQIEIECFVYKGTQDEFSAKFGNWLPGDRAEVNIGTIWANGFKVPMNLRENFIEIIGYEKIEQMALQAS